MMKSTNRLFTAVFIFSLGIASASAAQVADYNFNGTLSSDIGSAPDLVQFGQNPGFYTTDTVLGESCSVFEFDAIDDGGSDLEGSGFSLNISGLISTTEYTFVGLFYFEENDVWGRILAFTEFSDDGFYADDYGEIGYYLGADIRGSQPYSPFEYMLVAFTRQSDGTITGYKNGVPSFSIDDNDSAIIEDSILAIFQDEFDSDNNEHPSGRVANIQIYDNALSDQEVAALQPSCGAAATPTDVPANNPLALTILALFLAGFGGVLLWRRSTI